MKYKTTRNCASIRGGLHKKGEVIEADSPEARDFYARRAHDGDCEPMTATNGKTETPEQAETRRREQMRQQHKGSKE